MTPEQAFVKTIELVLIKARDWKRLPPGAVIARMGTEIREALGQLKSDSLVLKPNHDPLFFGDEAYERREAERDLRLAFDQKLRP